VAVFRIVPDTPFSPLVDLDVMIFRGRAVRTGQSSR
jgi:hypothetical protein